LGTAKASTLFWRGADGGGGQGATIVVMGWFANLACKIQ